MKRNTLMFVVSLFLCGCFAFALSVQSFGDDKKEVAKDVKFACSHHGPTHMQLTLSPENGTPRKIEFIGENNGAKWFVKIDGQDVQVANGSSVKVRTGDSITWSIIAANHGVAFAEQDLAQAMLEFDTTVGKPLVDLTTILTTTDWKNFGTKRWGTVPIDATTDPVVMVSCKVK